MEKSLEEIKRLSQEALNDPEFVKAFAAAKSPEETQKLLAGRGIEMTLEEVLAMGEAIGNDELNDDELENVSGGIGIVLGTLAVVGFVSVFTTAAVVGVELPGWIDKARKKKNEKKK